MQGSEEYKNDTYIPVCCPSEATNYKNLKNTLQKIQYINRPIDANVLESKVINSYP